MDDILIHTRGKHEFTTRVRPFPDAVFNTDNIEMEQEGWRRVWADVTLEGIFVVYRRDVKNF